MRENASLVEAMSCGPSDTHPNCRFTGKEHGRARATRRDPWCCQTACVRARYGPGPIGAWRRVRRITQIGVWYQQTARRRARIVLDAHGRSSRCMAAVPRALLTTRLPAPAAVWQLARPNHPIAYSGRGGESGVASKLSRDLCLTKFCSLQISTGLGAGIPAQREKGEWIEGVAIWVAVFLVSGVGRSSHGRSHGVTLPSCMLRRGPLPRPS